MKKFVKLASLIFIICLMVLAGFWVFKHFSEPAEADSDDNVSGYAWSVNIGWISFNGSNYGVNLDTDNGKLSGYAWSENIGWISFNESDTGAPPSDDPCADTTCIAKFEPAGQIGKSDVPLYGWARALAHGDGWDGWIRFDHGQADEVYLGTDKEFHGWAWGSDVVGWISFNCADRDICGSSNYKVLADINSPPIATNLTLVTETDDVNWCGIPTYFFSWTYSDPDGDSQTRFDFQIRKDSLVVVGKTVEGLDNPSPSTNTQTAGVAVSPLEDHIYYDETYTWRVKVYDSEGADSGWVDGEGSFTTRDHHYPNIDFTWAPSNPSALESVTFTDDSICYDDVITGSPCSSNDTFRWTIPKTTEGDPLVLFGEIVKATFSETGNWDVILKVTDSTGYDCSNPQAVGVAEPLPGWEEIKP